MTPPSSLVAGHRGHTRNISNSSTYTANTTDTSPESVTTHNTTPSPRLHVRQHGPTLLPKIRTQDSGSNHLDVSAGQNFHRRALSNPSNGRPRVQRSVTEPVESTGGISPVSCYSRASSVAPSPGLAHANLQPVIGRTHSRSTSAATIDDGVLSRYGYPTYRQLPSYLSNPYQTPSPTIYGQSDLSYLQPVQMLDAPIINIEEPFDFALDFSRDVSAEPMPAPISTSTTSLLTYLTQPTQPLNLCRCLTLATTRGSTHHFWWDVRNIRSWPSFSFTTLTSIPDLLPLLNFPHPSPSFLSQTSTSTITPQNEIDLATHISRIHFPRANLAATLSLGSSAPQFYLAPTTTSDPNRQNTPHFLANYTSDMDRTLSGLPRGRVVGLCRSFDRFNTGMRREGPNKKVEYLKTLAHLQKCMRDHSARYGFIVTEIELVCVRAGCDELGRPWFGFLEVSEPIALKELWHGMDEGEGGEELTVGLALWFLLMLAKKTPLPGMEGSFMDVGSGGTLGRQRVWTGEKGCEGMETDQEEQQLGKDGKDAWIPEPKLFETREAKTVRGWVWPQDPFHKREVGGSGRRRGTLV